MASSLALMHWQHPELPASIRLPWKVFQENLEDLRDDDPSHPEADTIRKQLEAIEVRGALPVFLDLDISEQEAYAEVSMMELSAYHQYRQKTEAAWNDFDCDEKAKWVPENHRAGLAHSRWAPLLAGGPPPCGPAEAPAKRRRIMSKTPAAGAGRGEGGGLGAGEEPAKGKGKVKGKGERPGKSKGKNKNKGKGQEPEKGCKRAWSWRSWGKVMIPCPVCGRRVSRSNMSKHQRSRRCMPA
jgi:hypothetical protein